MHAAPAASLTHVRPLPAFPVALLAVALPLLLSVASVPDSVFYNQLAALAGWGLWLVWDGLAARAPGRAVDRAPNVALKDSASLSRRT